MEYSWWNPDHTKQLDSAQLPSLLKQPYHERSDRNVYVRWSMYVTWNFRMYTFPEMCQLTLEQKHSFLSMYIVRTTNKILGTRFRNCVLLLPRQPFCSINRHSCIHWARWKMRSREELCDIKKWQTFSVVLFRTSATAVKFGSWSCIYSTAISEFYFDFHFLRVEKADSGHIENRPLKIFTITVRTTLRDLREVTD